MEPFSSDSYQSNFILNIFFKSGNFEISSDYGIQSRKCSVKIQCSSLAKRSHNNDFCLSLNLGLKSESKEPVNFIEKSDLCFQLVSFLANCLYQLHFHRQDGHATRQIHEIFVWFSRKFLQFEPGFHTKLHSPHWLLRVLCK